MTQSDERDREIAELRHRLSRLSGASLHINESLEVDTSLRAVMDSARSLTDSRYAVIVTLDDANRVEDHLVAGLNSGDVERLWQAPEGQRFFEYLNALPGPLRVGQFEEFTGSIGLAEFRSPVSVTAFMAAPILHQGVRSGNIYVGSDEPGREFSQEDEETLVLFASQAAQVIANARRHREEQRARADLETLIDTSPVGVAVFDAATGAPKSFNREAMRIVDSLRNPDQSPEDLLAAVTFIRADGREVSLREFPVVEALRSGETLRAEEVVVSAPDGRSVTLLVNATPIISQEGAVESMVVTLQDRADVEELERMRAEFLAMVSHELRIPLTSIMGAATAIMNSPADLDPAVVRQFVRIIGDQADHMHALVADLVDVARIDTGTLPVNPEPAEVAVLVDRARNAFRSAGGRNNLAIDIEPDLSLVMADRRRIAQVLGNLLSNAARHSPEPSVIRMSAVREDVNVAFSVTDQGRGIPAESLPHLFRKFSRAQSDDLRDGTGLGLAICKGIVEAHGGRIRAESDGPGLGACFTFTLPTVEQVGSVADIRSPLISDPSSRRARQDKRESVPILLVDDDPQTLRYVRDILVQSGYAPIATGEPSDVVRLMEEERPQLVLLDLVLPEADGIELMNEILKTADVPVIFLSAYGRDELIAEAFDMGAADYVVKPFSPTELTARIRAALRSRATPAPEPLEPYVMENLVVDYSGHRVTVGGHPVRLKAMEYRLLVELSANAGQVLTYGHLLERVWRERSGSDVRPMRTIVSKLRRKLGDDADNPTYIFTEPRIGYRMPRGQTSS